LHELGIDDPFGLAMVAITEAAWMVLGGHDGFREAADVALELARACGSPSVISVAAFTKTTGMWRDDPVRAAALLDEAIPIMRGGGTTVVSGYMMTLRAQMWSEIGEHRRALEALREGLLLGQDRGDVSMNVTSFGYAVQILVRAGNADGAAIAAGACFDGPLAFFGIPPAHERPHLEWAQQRARELLGADRYDAVAATGAALTMDEVVAALLSAIDDAIRDRAS
jgi:hypothetical protein